MSAFTYLASDSPLGEVKNPHYKTLSVNEALAMNMQVPDFMLEDGFDRDVPDVLLWSDVSYVIDLDKHTFDDGGFDDDFSILPCDRNGDFFTEKEFCAYVEWQYTDGRAKRLIDYFKKQLEHTREVELWHGWVGIDFATGSKKVMIPIEELTADDIKKLMDIDLLKEPITHYCYVITAT